MYHELNIINSLYMSFQIYPKHKDLYDWVDVDQKLYVIYNMTYLQESFNYVSIYIYITSYFSCKAINP